MTHTTKKRIQKVLAGVVSMMILFTPSTILFAQQSNTSLTLTNPLSCSNCNTVTGILTAVLQVVIQLGAVVATLMFIYVGVLYLTAQGDEKQVTRAHGIFMDTVIGTAILLGAQAIILVVQGTINNVSGNNIFPGTS